MAGSCRVPSFRRLREWFDKSVSIYLKIFMVVVGLFIYHVTMCFAIIYFRKQCWVLFLTVWREFWRDYCGASVFLNRISMACLFLFFTCKYIYNTSRLVANRCKITRAGVVNQFNRTIGAFGLLSLA